MARSGNTGKKKWQASLWDSGSFKASETNIPVEQPVELAVNGKSLAVFHCTPKNLNELATGFMLGRGLINSVTQITDMEVDARGGKVSVILRQTLKNMKGHGNKTVIYSGCGQEPVNLPSTGNPETLVAEAAFSSARLREGLTKTLSRGKIYREARGVHSAAICGRMGRILVLREDIGRHNAMDKVLGWVAARCLDPAVVFVAVSGRVSAEAVEK
ncbi:MAG: formate dehydrogenase accessory sulfurtransferase FdhD, partial [Actinomycetota bacterium]